MTYSGAQAAATWTQLVYATTATSAVFNRGVNGVTYEFRARGTDNVGNVQEWGDAQASTTVFSHAGRNRTVQPLCITRS